MKLYVMCGIPNSGKSTKALALAEETGARIISLDSYSYLIRSDLTPRAIIEIALEDVKTALENGEDIIYDTTNSTVYDRTNVLRDCQVEGCEYICVYMDTPSEQAIARDATGWSAIFAERFEPPTAEEGFDEIITSLDGVGETPINDSDVLDVLLGVLKYE